MQSWKNGTLNLIISVASTGFVYNEYFLTAENIGNVGKFSQFLHSESKFFVTAEMPKF